MPEVVINYQSPHTASSLTDYLAGRSLELAVCWKLTAAPTSPVAGTVVAACSDTKDMTLPGHPGVVFRSSRGGLPTAIDIEAGSESAGLQVESVFDDDEITEDAIRAGDWHGAKFEIFTVNRETLGMGQLVEFSGRIGKVEAEGPRFSAEARPLTACAQAQVGRLTTAGCARVKRLGDGFCKVNLDAPAAGDGGAIRVTGTVTSAAGATEFFDTSRTEGTDYFDLVKFTSGALDGREFEVFYTNDGGGKKFRLRRGAPRNIPVGSTYQATRKCNRTPEDCRAKFANIVNYRGYPHITNVEEVHRIDRAQ